MLLKDQAYSALKRKILSGEFAGGTFLSERQLVIELGGMSKTPIRAALERLQADGLITVAPQQGILVRAATLEEIADVFDLRVALETFVVERLAGRLTAEQEAAFQHNLAMAEACIISDDEAAFSDLDAMFHLALCECYGNREIVFVMQRNRDKLARVAMRVLRRDTGRMATSHADHVAIFNAVRTGDGMLAAQRVRQHLEYGKRILIS
jgi:DNA-binding GntR family transcriptional regulator